MDMKYNFELTMQEAQLVMEGLEEMPFKKVVDIVFKLRGQVQTQSKRQEPPKDEAENRVE